MRQDGSCIIPRCLIKAILSGVSSTWRGKLIDAARFYKNGNAPVRFQTSPHSLAIAVATEKKQNELEFLVTAHDVVNIGLKYGSCSHEEVTKRFQSSATKNNYCSEVRRVLQITDSGSKSNPRAINESCNLRVHPIWGLRGTSVLSVAMQVDESVSSIGAQFNNICTGDAHESLDEVPRADKFYAMQVIDPVQRIVTLKQKIDLFLEAAKPMPVGIRYCLDFLIAGQPGITHG